MRLYPRTRRSKWATLILTTGTLRSAGLGTTVPGRGSVLVEHIRLAEWIDWKVQPYVAFLSSLHFTRGLGESLSQNAVRFTDDNKRFLERRSSQGKDRSQTDSALRRDMALPVNLGIHCGSIRPGCPVGAPHCKLWNLVPGVVPCPSMSAAQTSIIVAQRLTTIRSERYRRSVRLVKHD